MFFFIFIFLSINLLSQYDQFASFDNGTTMDYYIRENDPNKRPNIFIDFGASIGTHPYLPFALNYEFGAEFQFKKFCFQSTFSYNITEEMVEDIVYASNSDNLIENFYDFKCSFLYDVWVKKKLKKANIVMKVTRIGYNTLLSYRIPQDISLKKNLSVSIGYQTHNGSINNSMRSSQNFYLTDINQFPLVQDIPEISEADMFEQRDFVSFHTNLRAHHIFLGLQYKVSAHIIAPYKENRSIREKIGGHSDEWGFFGHMIINTYTRIQPIEINDAVRIYSPADLTNNRFLYTINPGQYDVQHEGRGGFKLTPLGCRFGYFIRYSNIKNSLIPAMKAQFEFGVLPGIIDHQDYFSEVNLGRFFCKLIVAFNIGVRIKS